MKLKNIFLFILLFCCVACQRAAVDQLALEHGDEFNINAVIGERSSQTKASADPYYIGRSEFVDTDRMVILAMKRTLYPLVGFSYENLLFTSNDSQSWSRTVPAGQSDKIYWSDNASEHTIIGYSLPRNWYTSSDWDSASAKWSKPDAAYQGHLSSMSDTDNPATLLYDESRTVDMSSSQKIKDEDILLTYADDLTPQAGSVATVVYKHGLASVKIVVNITGFAATSYPMDAQTTMADMVIKDQPWEYRWAANGVVLEQPASPSAPKDILAWNTVPAGVGSGLSRTYTFESLIVPGAQTDMTMQFSVTYPRALNPSEFVTQRYTAVVPSINFVSGHTTTVNISLNHADENITIGAVYIDWENIESPDQSELRKSSINMSTVSRDSVTTTFNMPKPTLDDATWLYEPETAPGTVVDVYGNDGSAEHPYLIKTSYELLSFAYEVNEGRSFTGKNILLDASIIMQPSSKQKKDGALDVDWIGIGDATHPFDGNFMAAGKNIKKLQGSPLFNHIGPNGCVQQLNLVDVYTGITGHAIFAEVNEGLIVGCMAGNKMTHEDKINLAGTTGSGEWFGGLVAQNSGTIAACHCNTTLNVSTAGSKVAGLVGKNTGTIVSTYAAGNITATSSTILGSVAENSGTMTFCVFDSDVNKAPVITDGHDANGAIGMTTKAMQVDNASFVGVIKTLDDPSTPTLNGTFWAWIKADESNRAKFGDVHYEYVMADYPWLN